MKVTFRVGQVWHRKDNTIEKVCIGALNIELRLLWINGWVDQVNPICTYEYLADIYEQEAGWEI